MNNFRKVPVSRGGVKPEPLCVKEVNAARQKLNKPPLKYNSGLESTAKSSVNYMIKNNCYDSGCKTMPSAFKRTGWWTTRKLSYIEESLAGSQDVKLDCNKFVTEWFGRREDSFNLSSLYLTDIGCFAAECKKCKHNLLISCTYGRPSMKTIFKNNKKKKSF